MTTETGFFKNGADVAIEVNHATGRRWESGPGNLSGPDPQANGQSQERCRERFAQILSGGMHWRHGFNT
jgi:hypothetical protein